MTNQELIDAYIQALRKNDDLTLETFATQNNINLISQNLLQIYQDIRASDYYTMLFDKSITVSGKIPIFSLKTEAARALNKYPNLQTLYERKAGQDEDVFDALYRETIKDRRVNDADNDQAKSTMDIPKIIDVLLAYIYKQKQEIGFVSKILTQTGFDYNYTDSHIICGKLEELKLFEQYRNNYTEYADLTLYPNTVGYEFVAQYGTYSNYLKVTQQEERRQKALSEKDAKGSYWGGIGGVGSLIISFLVFIYSWYQDGKQDKVNEELRQSNEQLRKQLQQKEDINVIRQVVQQSMDSLAGLREE